MKKSWILYLFGIDLALELFSHLSDYKDLRLFTKPLLLILLFAFVGFQSFRVQAIKTVLLLALAFSWAGDMFLLFDTGAGMHFILGLASFLTAHIFFLILFYMIRKRRQPIPSWNWMVTILALGYTVGLLTILFPSLGALRVPVLLYALILSCMFIASAQAFSWQTSAGKWVIIGALLFVASDSLLALNKFYTPLPYAGFLIMSTYALAQLGITLGVTKSNS